jgi:restriction system protein
MARPSYETTVTHVELGEAKTIRGSDRYVVAQRARKQMRDWDEKWRRQQEKERKQANKELAIERTIEAQKAIEDVENTLKHTLSIDDRIDWDDLKDFSTFPEPRPVKPDKAAPKYRPKLGGLASVIPSMKQRALEEAEALFREEYSHWQILDAKWALEKLKFLEKQQKRNEAVDRQKEEYHQKSSLAVMAYCEMVLGNSSYPDSFPQQFELDYNPAV